MNGNMNARTSKKELLHAIGEVSFVLDDLRLYLDTHPDCAEALSMYSEYQNKREVLVKQFEKSYGALSSYGPNEFENWIWNKNGYLEGSEMN